MVEIFQNFERTAVLFSPGVLIAPGLAAVLVGLFLWLGGLGFRKLLVAALGAISGAIGGFFITGQNIASVAAIAGISAIVAVIFERIFVTMLAAALAAAFALVVLAGPFIENSQPSLQIAQDRIPQPGLTMSVAGSLQTMKVFTLDFADKIKHGCSQMPGHNWAIIAALIAIFVLAGFSLWRLTSALCCAALGTLLIFAGMILLLLYKSSAPVDSICHSPSFYLGVFMAMIAFGTIEQLLLCKSAKEKATGEKQVSKTSQEPVEKKHFWRTT